MQRSISIATISLLSTTIGAAVAVAPAVSQQPTIQRVQKKSVVTQPRLVVVPQRIVRPLPALTATRQDWFVLPAERGAEQVLDFQTSQAGRVVVEAVWRGSEGLLLTLTRASESRSMARISGGSPLRLEADLTSAMVAIGGHWQLHVANLSPSSGASGRIDIRYPIPLLRKEELKVVGKVKGPTPIKAESIRDLSIVAPPSPPPNPFASLDSGGGAERSILANGDVEILYPDGTRKVIHDCGWTTTFPDGTAQVVQCNQAQAPTMPPLPSDPSLAAFLDRQSEDLLSHISRLVDNDQAEIELYLAFESQEASSIYERIRLRTSTLGKLLQ